MPGTARRLSLARVGSIIEGAARAARRGGNDSVGRNRRRGNRPRGTAPQPTPGDGTHGKPRPAWRQTLDSWGGLPVVGSLAVVIVVVGVLIFLNRPGSSVDNSPFTPKQRENVSGTTWGLASAPVKIIEFADFQCPFCRRFTEDTEPQLADEFIKTGKVQLIFHNYAFIGSESTVAAEAAECAADQNHFWDYHDLLYLRQGQENSGVFSSQHLKDFAQTLHEQFPDFDVAKFSACLDSGQKKSLVQEESQQAQAAGVQSTPSFLINGQMLTGAQDISVFRQAINQALTGTPTPVATATPTP